MLSSMADNLAILLSSFYLGDLAQAINSLPLFIHSHEMWVQRAEKIVQEAFIVDDEILNEMQQECALAKWMRGSGKVLLDSTGNCEHLQTNHKNFHQHMLELATYAKSGDSKNSQLLLETIRSDSELVFECLNDLIKLHSTQE
jgi:hypothetical protein